MQRGEAYEMQDEAGKQAAQPGKRSGSYSSATKFEGVSLTTPGGPNGPPSTVRELKPFVGVEVMILKVSKRSGVL